MADLQAGSHTDFGPDDPGRWATKRQQEEEVWQAEVLTSEGKA
jgi:hypothetical protein